MELELFMKAYMCELEEKMNNNLDFFKKVTYQLDEANSDKEIKIKLKEFILNKLPKLNKITSIVSENMELQKINIYDYEIIKVKVPEELSEEDKKYIKQTRNSVYTNPDLLLFIKVKEEIYRFPIEVKTTLNNNIPGSSIQQIDENDWVIFIKHNNDVIIDITTGKYINSINGTMQFPDRSPRPQVSYKNLKSWNKNFRKIEENTITYFYDETLNERKKMIKDWQMLLSERWLEVLKTKKKNTNEPWFNNNIRKFAIMLLDNYDKLADEDRKKFKEFIARNVSNEDEQ